MNIETIYGALIAAGMLTCLITALWFVDTGDG
jgi:acyl dehydratase